MFDKILSFWFIGVFMILVPLTYRFLHAIDFSKIFKKNAIKEIKYLLLAISVMTSYLLASAFIAIIEKISVIAS